MVIPNAYSLNDLSYLSGRCQLQNTSACCTRAEITGNPNSIFLMCCAGLHPLATNVLVRDIWGHAQQGLNLPAFLIIVLYRVHMHIFFYQSRLFARRLCLVSKSKRFLICILFSFFVVLALLDNFHRSLVFFARASQATSSGTSLIFNLSTSITSGQLLRSPETIN